MFRNVFLTGLFFILSLPAISQAQQLHQELVGIYKATVLSIERESEEPIIGTDTYHTVQVVKVELLEGEDEGLVVEFENDLVILEPGDNIFVVHTVSINGDNQYYLKDVNRHVQMIFLAFLFVALLWWFAGRQGLRALASLALSVGAILFILIPAMLAGYNPILVSLLVAGIILALVLFGTHGFKPHSFLAFGGTFGAVLATSFVAWVFVDAMRLTGFGTDESVYLNFATNGQLDFSALLLGSIIIGVLGVLDDVAITQASVVQELKAANEKLLGWELYHRAIRVGRDHVGSLVNTLALAYVGAALPLVLLLASSDAAFGLTMNQEVIAAEYTRILVGSIGLILAVPFTTMLAAWWFGVHGVGGNIRTHHHH